MLFKHTFIFALFSVSAQVVSATPPACLLAIVNSQPNPTDFSSICHVDAAKMHDQITTLCGNNVGAAMTAYVSTCKANGFKVGTPQSSKSKIQSSKASPTTKTYTGTTHHVQSASGTTGSKTTDNTKASITKNAKSTYQTKVHQASIPLTNAPYPTGGSSTSAKASGTGAIHASSTTLPNYKPSSSGGKVDAESFAAIALAAAGLVIFL